MTQLPPPFYQAVSPPQSFATLPAYSRRPKARPTTASSRHDRETTEHVFELRSSRKANPWATLKLKSSARNPDQLPTFLEGDHIRGSLSLSLEHSDAIQSVSVSIKGSIMGNGPDNEQVFLDTNLTLWSKNMGDPKHPEKRYSGKLSGEHYWPFILSLPKEVSIILAASAKKTGPSYPLPQSFLERHTRASIHYELTLHITRRSAFRAGSKFQTMFVYVPATRPGPPSTLRQLAYQHNSPLLGPEADPDGWATLPPIVMRGKIFTAREIQLKYVLSLAKPLCYTRGSVIPCVCTVSCDDSQALDLLAIPSAINLILRRRVQFPENPAQADSSAYSIKVKDESEDMGSAVWWPAAERETPVPQAGSFMRRLNGEISLLKSLKSSCAIGRFSIDYSVAMFPPRVAAFTSKSTGCLLEQSVGIATMSASGPRARSYAPPEYPSG